MYGEYIKGLRLQKALSLREFSRRIEEDPSNWSKVERELLPPPKERAKSLAIAKVLDITEGSEEWNKLEDFASVDSATIPAYIMNDKEVLDVLPAFFRAVGSVRPTKEELEKLIKKLRED
jgi:transcriptional regulator with XRE-family HTH domain